MRIKETLRLVLGSLNGSSADLVRATVGRIQANADLIGSLSDTDQLIYECICDVLLFDCTSLEGAAIVNFEHLPASWSQRPEVRAELADLAGMVIPLGVNPAAVLEALLEDIQGELAVSSAKALIESVELKLPARHKMRAFRELVPPTRVTSAQNNDWAKPAGQWLDEHRASLAIRPELTLSSGYPTLDMACSSVGDPIGLIQPGEFWVAGAGSGHGKSAFTRRVVSAMCEDLVNGWGYRDAKVILAFTEEEAHQVARAAMLDDGQSFHHLRNNIVLAKVSGSRHRVIQVVYDAVKEAALRSNETGAPITDYLPYLYVLDYISAIVMEGEQAATDAIAKTADLLMRGIAAWDPDMMAHYSGVSFREYAQMDWPAGMSEHRVAVLVLSQLRQENSSLYRPGKSPDSDFVLLDDNGKPYWELRENDYIIPRREALFGSSVLINHATGIFFLHRSQPKAAQVKDPVTKRVVRLADTRARFIIEKARKAVSMPYIPMRFDTNPEGYRGQFYDDLAARQGVAAGRYQVTSCYQQEGDPMLPPRPARSPFASARY